MLLRYIIILSFFFTALFANSQAQRPQYIFYTDEQIWLAYNLQYRATDKWGYSLDINHRRGAFINNHFQSLGRFGINYYQSPSLTLSAGYAFMVPGRDDSRRIRFEHRLWQQLLFADKNDNRDIFFRFRLEERKFLYNYFREDGFYIRMRFAFSWHKHLSKKLDFILQEEIMFQFGYYLRNISPIDFQQNRIQAGLKFNFTDQINLNIAYMHILQYRNTAWDYNSNHALHIIINHNLDHRNAKKNTEHSDSNK